MTRRLETVLINVRALVTVNTLVYNTNLAFRTFLYKIDSERLKKFQQKNKVLSMQWELNLQHQPSLG